jgi:Trypsin-like peptidase domain
MLSNDWLNSFAPVGGLRADNQWAAFGACVFLHKESILWMVTARHVLEKIGRQSLTILVPPASGDGPIVIKIGEILANHGYSWVEDNANDLAAAPVPAPLPQSFGFFGLKALTPENCLPLAQLLPSTPCFTVGCPYGVLGLNPQRPTPLVLDGIISGVDPIRRKVFTSAPTFPGNSGGPLVASLPAFRVGKQPAGYRPGLFIAGIMLETGLIPDPLGRNPPLHLGIAASADAVLEMLASKPAEAITDRIIASRPVPQPG